MNVSFVTEDLGTYHDLFKDRSGFQRAFRELVIKEPSLRGDVLDIGAAGGLPPPLEGIESLVKRLDGVDPNPVVMQHPALANRWHGFFEDMDIPAAGYDLAFAYNVVEHIKHARPFFEKLSRVLKPGGVFWALTPHAGHPFCTISSAIPDKVKATIARRDPGVNAYASYYRLNSSRKVLKALDGLGFASAEFHYLPCVQWELAFPRMMRWAPHAYDYLLGSRFARWMLIIAYRLELEA